MLAGNTVGVQVPLSAPITTLYFINFWANSSGKRRAISRLDDVFTCHPEDQQKLVDTWARATEETLGKLPGIRPALVRSQPTNWLTTPAALDYHRYGWIPMNKSHWLLLALAALGCFNTGVVWLIQYSVYPLWRLVGRDEFARYHTVWMQSSWPVVLVPGVLAFAGSILMLRFVPSGLPPWAIWAGVALQLGIQGVTAFWLSALDRDVVGTSGAVNVPAYENMFRVNWIRIVLVSAYALLVFWMVNRALWPQVNMTRGRVILLCACALGLFAVGNVWLVQLVCYRLWAYVGEAEAYAYHFAWWRSIWFVLFVPAGLLFVAGLVLPWLRQSGAERNPAWLGLALQVATAIGTAAWWAPLMARLVSKSGIMLARDYSLLMSTHWIRLALITAYRATYLAMLIKATRVNLWSGS